MIRRTGVRVSPLKLLVAGAQSMKRVAAALGLAVCAVAPASAELQIGDLAPDFRVEGALAGQRYDFHLADALKKGPVVVYFFPAAFTAGCTLETKMFADAIEEFSANGATLIGVTRGNTDRLLEFSAKTCRNRFPVAGVTKQTVRDYKVSMAFTPGWSNRTSYVIAPGGRITLAYTALKPNDHVQKTLEAIRALRPAGAG
jgi:thioredoxin-dependent peroxiredoxin